LEAGKPTHYLGLERPSDLAKLAGSLGIDGKTARRYLDLLEGLCLVRPLPPWSRNAGKRLVKSAKVYWRDSGILHALAGLQDLEQVLGHPLCGASWEGYCVEQILELLPKGAVASHYRTHAGAEVDLVIETADGEVLAVEIKRTLSPRVTPGLVESMATLGAKRGVILIPQGESYPLSLTVTACGLVRFLETL
jgi:predicted AAA+ superfamily ATPase